MRTTLLLGLVTASLTVQTASADDRLHLTPPLYREQAHAMQQMRHTSDMMTTPQPVAAAAPLVAEPNKVMPEIVASAR